MAFFAKKLMSDHDELPPNQASKKRTCFSNGFLVCQRLGVPTTSIHVFPARRAPRVFWLGTFQTFMFHTVVSFDPSTHTVLLFPPTHEAGDFLHLHS